MPKFRLNSRVLVLIATALLLIFSLMALMVPMGTLAQDNADLPTPTPQPVGDVPYTLTQVGGTEATFTMPAFEQDGISIGETTVTSDYPFGMIFTTTITSTSANITNVTLSIESVSGSRDRAVATFDDDSQTWTAHLYEERGQPAWSQFDARWSVVDANGVGIETEPITFDYVDPTRQWWRVESDHIIIYWYDGLTGEPETIAQAIVNSMAATEERRAIGFGGPLSYKPIGVIYANSTDFGEVFSNEAESANWSSFTNSDLGMTIYIVGSYDDEYFERYADCWMVGPREEYTEERLTSETILSTVPSAVIYLYQYDKSVRVGPSWWREGQTEWFSTAPGAYDLRLRQLALLDNTLPTLEGDNIGDDGAQADGCYRLSHDVGASFINWLLTTYGGLETHAKIVELLRSQKSLDDAIAEVTGKSFLEIENEWRAYIGFNILSLAEVDPASALEDPIDPAFAVGDLVTLPAMPLQVPLNEAPGPNQLSVAACFGGTDVTILRIGSLDSVNYYEVNCTGFIGWVTLGQLQGTN